ncbi:MAG TPA: pyruvate dehydrogenase complex dihydrolipoamide acetyltransferase [bacterium]|nr:pyruvate dehydrogenase complex dihydrolipoamide acetyltransferase [bacterium]HQG44188.1 pyruvate dehydrogenase complex dihydrolipoamide acetyltransferase [bacterium]HQI47846.1 pyruvate dehydrogenase complex dihydrolipoamide acetyltransferase [bacterium]HQJ64320.1 pyruvate dehydrogenase complex dihydrolipoamide acetyltransferase [bacterium]
MASKLTMPKLSDTMTLGVLLKWHKREGETVDAGEVIAEAESDKATMELEAFDAGTLLKIVVPEGGKVPVGGLLAIIGEKGEDITALLDAAATAPEAAAAKGAEPSAASAAAVKSEAPLPVTPVPDMAPADVILTSDSVRIKASPLARKIAAEKGIDLRRVQGSGTGGRIISRDLAAMPAQASAAAAAALAIAAPATAPAGRSEQPLNTMRTAIAARMSQSKSTVPHFYLTMEIDMERMVALRAEMNAAQSEIKISFNDLIVKAAAAALVKHPRVNGSFAGDRFILYGQTDIGLAVALEDGLITPVVRNASAKSIGQIAMESRLLIEKAKARKLTPEEYTGSTFTISNLGMFDIEEFSAIINPPEAAILAVGAILEKPVIREGVVAIGRRMKVTLSCDHRIIDGATGALFLKEFRTFLENPALLLL